MCVQILCAEVVVVCAVGVREYGHGGVLLVELVCSLRLMGCLGDHVFCVFQVIGHMETANRQKVSNLFEKAVFLGNVCRRARGFGFLGGGIKIEAVFRVGQCSASHRLLQWLVIHGCRQWRVFFVGKFSECWLCADARVMCGCWWSCADT